MPHPLLAKEKKVVGRLVGGLKILCLKIAKSSFWSFWSTTYKKKSVKLESKEICFLMDVTHVYKFPYFQVQLISVTLYVVLIGWVT